jgi:hypothetical protein
LVPDAKNGELSRGWKAWWLYGAYWMPKEATVDGQHERSGLSLWRSRDLAAWGIATGAIGEVPNPAWWRSKPRDV